MSIIFRASLVALVAVSLVLSTNGVSRDRCVTNGGEFDYFVLVRQWPGSYCNEHTCPMLKDRGFRFTIHGLWPNYEDGSYPCDCDRANEFDENKLSDLMDELEYEWPSYMDADADPDKTFWQHEWDKHGTCALSVLPSEHSFFQNVLDLHRRYNLAEALRGADILPSPDKLYRTKALIDAIDAKYGARPAIHCSGEDLYEIWMCFDRDLNPFNCDETSNITTTCSKLYMRPLHSNGVSEHGISSESSAVA